jgi:hypothetical protein
MNTAIRLGLYLTTSLLIAEIFWLYCVYDWVPVLDTYPY